MSTEEVRIAQNPEAAEVDTEEFSAEQLSEQRKIRREKLRTLQEADRNPYLEENRNVTAHSKDIKDNFEAMEDQEVSCAGRIMAFRQMGKASFIDLQDKQGRIQCFVSRDAIGADEYKGKTLDVRGIVDLYDGKYQIRVFSADDITIVK